MLFFRAQTLDDAHRTIRSLRATRPSTRSNEPRYRSSIRSYDKLITKRQRGAVTLTPARIFDVDISLHSFMGDAVIRIRHVVSDEPSTELQKLEEKLKEEVQGLLTKLQQEDSQVPNS